MSSDHKAPPAITTGSVDARLDAIVRRHGGKPKPLPSVSSKPTFPAIGRRDCDGQLAIDDEPDAPADGTAS